MLFCSFHRFGKGGGGPAGGLEGRAGGGRLAPGSGGGARFFGSAGNSLLGVEGPEVGPEVDPEPELFVLSFDICLGGGPVGLELGSAGGSPPLVRLLQSQI